MTDVLTPGTETRRLASSPRVSLWPIENRHILGLQRIISHVETRKFWRTRGAYWSPQQLQSQLSRNVLFSAIATYGHDPDDPILGLGEILDPDLVDSRAHLSLVTDDQYSRTGLPIEFAMLFVKAAFDRYPIEKLHLEVHSSNSRLVPGLRRFLTTEGHFAKHLRIDGEWHDIDVFALWRSDMDRLSARLGRKSKLGSGGET